jgi:hypothetical protein
MASSLPPFPPFNVEDDPTATGQRWTKWKKRFENFLLAMDIDDETRKRALPFYSKNVAFSYTCTETVCYSNFRPTRH